MRRLYLDDDGKPWFVQDDGLADETAVTAGDK
jgi:hypothetical protein